MKEVWIDAICGQGIKILQNSRLFSNFIRFTGDQNNESWEFDRAELELHSEEVLEALYYRLKTTNQGK